MSDEKTVDCSQITIDTLDKLQVIQNEIHFLSNMLLAWDVDLFPPTANDLSAMSRICNQISEHLEESKEFLQPLL